MKLRKTLAVLAAAGMLGAAGPAAAGYVGAESMLNIANLLVVDVATGAPVSGLTLDTGVGSRTGFLLVSYNSPTTGSFGAGGPVDPVDLDKICVGPSCGSLPPLLAGSNPNNTTFMLTSGAGSFAYADMSVSGNALAGGGAGFTRADAIGEPTVIAAGSSNIQNTAEAKVEFEVGKTVTAQFLAVWSAIVQAFADPGTGNPSAIANANFQLTLDFCGNGVSNCQSASQVFTWNPVNINHSVNTAGASDSSVVPVTTSTSPTRDLVAGDRYRVTIGQTSLASVRAIPEPQSLALLGVALAAAGLFARRQRKAG